MKKNYFIAVLIANSLLLMVSSILAYIFFGNINHLLVINFDAYRGISFLGTKWDVFGIVGLALIITLLNFAFLKLFRDREPFLAYFMGFFTVLFLTLILISIGAIISVN